MKKRPCIAAGHEGRFMVTVRLIYRSAQVLGVSVVATLIWTFGGYAAQPEFQISPFQTSTGTLRLIEVTPKPGSEVTKDTVVEARLAFSISPNDGGEFFVLAQFETNLPGRTTDGSFPLRKTRTLQQRNGEVTLSFPLTHVWDEPDVKRPLTMWFFLNKKAGNTGTGAALVGPVQYITQ
jgi:hypothetical protein